MLTRCTEAAGLQVAGWQAIRGCGVPVYTGVHGHMHVMTSVQNMVRRTGGPTHAYIDGLHIPATDRCGAGLLLKTTRAFSCQPGVVGELQGANPSPHCLGSPLWAAERDDKSKPTGLNKALLDCTRCPSLFRS